MIKSEKAENNTTKPFFNTTIPSDWEVKTVDEIALKEKGSIKIGPFGSQLKKEEFVENGVKVYDQETAFNNNFNYGTNFITEKKFQTLKSCELKPGDLIISMMGTIGASAIVPKDAPRGILNSHLLRVRPDKSIISEEFLKISISDSPFTVNQIKRKSHGGIMSGLSAGIMKSVEIILPPLSEQRAIALVLCLMDTAINQNNQLIAQKELRKKWLMQNLLTGKKRLNGFDGEWKKERLENYLVKHDEKSTSSNQYPVLTSSRRGIFLQSEYYTRDVASENNTGYNVVPRGYFTYRHMSDDLIFKFNVNDIVDKGIVSTLYPVFTVKNIDQYFLLCKLNEGNEFKIHAQEQKQGGSRTYVYFKTLCQLKLNLPLLEEQTAIAHVLKAADKEIQLLKAKADKLREQKKGMMQVLLTGKKRLKIN